MPKKSRRKRLTKRKQTLIKVVRQPVENVTEAKDCPSSCSSFQPLSASSSIAIESSCSITDDVICTENVHSVSIHDGFDHDCESSNSTSGNSLSEVKTEEHPIHDGFDHDCEFSNSTSGNNLIEVKTEELPICIESSAPAPPPEDLLMDVKRKLDKFLHCRWMSFIENSTITVVCLSSGKCAATQRTLVFSLSGEVELYVHCQKIVTDPYLKNLGQFMQLHQDNVNDFVDRAVSIISNVKAMKVCSGYDDDQFQSVWSTCPFGFVDKNPYQEDRFEETFRSLSCLRLVTSKRWRCSECAKLLKPLKRRSESAALERPNSRTAHKHYTDEQMLLKLEDQARHIYNATKNVSNVKKVLARYRIIHTVGQLGIKRKKGNSTEGQECIKVTSKETV